MNKHNHFVLDFLVLSNFQQKDNKSLHMTLDDLDEKLKVCSLSCLENNLFSTNLFGVVWIIKELISRLFVDCLNHYPREWLMIFSN